MISRYTSLLLCLFEQVAEKVKTMWTNGAFSTMFADEFDKMKLENVESKNVIFKTFHIAKVGKICFTYLCWNNSTVMFLISHCTGLHCILFEILCTGFQKFWIVTILEMYHYITEMNIELNILSSFFFPLNFAQCSNWIASIYWKIHLLKVPREPLLHKSETS